MFNETDLTLFSGMPVEELIDIFKEGVREKIMDSEFFTEKDKEICNITSRIPLLHIHLDKQELEDGMLLIPYSGSDLFLNCTVKGSPSKTVIADLYGNMIKIKFNSYDDPQKISSELQNIVDLLKGHIKNINYYIAEFNNKLPFVIRNSFEDRQDYLRKVKLTLQEVKLPS